MNFSMSKVLSRQISYISLSFGCILLVFLGGFGWWAATRIDARSVSRQSTSVQRAFADISHRVAVEQESSTVWDDSVVAMRAGDEAWIAANLAEWMSGYFGHDRIYLLDAADIAVRSVDGGRFQPSGAFDRDRISLMPLIDGIRQRIAHPADGLEGRLQVSDIVVLGDGQVGIASVAPILPSTSQVLQEHGSEYLHVSIRLIDRDLLEEVAARTDAVDLEFSRQVRPAPGRTLLPLRDNKGQEIGYFTWSPELPALQLIRETAVAFGTVLIGALLMVVTLFRRLRRTTSRLEESEAEAQYLAMHDPLARVANRAKFDTCLAKALANLSSGGPAPG
jgi:sensor domain CHASE-containing protein